MAFALLCAAPVAAQSPVDRAALDRLQSRVSESLYELPDYTCRLDIRRAELEPKARRKISLDNAKIISLEVAIIDHKEHYALAGSPNFSDLPPSQLVGDGLVSTGAFAAYARDILVNRVGTIRYAGEEVIGEEPALRYDYNVDLSRSRYHVTNNGQSAIVPYRGSLWATTDGDVLLRLTVHVDELPPYVGVKRITTQIDYQTALLEDHSLIVPKQTRVSMILSDGGESVNETRFTNCRSFDASSTLSC